MGFRPHDAFVLHTSPPPTTMDKRFHSRPHCLPQRRYCCPPLSWRQGQPSQGRSSERRYCCARGRLFFLRMDGLFVAFQSNIVGPLVATCCFFGESVTHALSPIASAIFCTSLLVSSLMGTVGLVANSVAIGAPIWIFFLQGPLLFSYMGREKFLHPMMKLTELLFRWTLPSCSAVALLASLIRSTLDDSKLLSLTSSTNIWAGLALASTLVNSILVVPKALKAGLRATQAKEDEASNTVKGFAVNGGSRSQTKTLHQTVVLFVLLAEICAVMHVYHVVSG